MQVHGQHALDTHGLQHVGHDLGRDRHAGGARAAVLAGVAEVGNHRADALGRCTLEGVHHDQQFHQVVVGRCAGRLHDEDVARTHVLLDLDGDFSIGEATHVGCTQRGAEVLNDFSGHARIGIAGEDHDVRMM